MILLNEDFMTDNDSYFPTLDIADVGVIIIRLQSHIRDKFGIRSSVEYPDSEHGIVVGAQLVIKNDDGSKNYVIYIGTDLKDGAPVHLFIDNYNKQGEDIESLEVENMQELYDTVDKYLSNDGE